MCGGRQSLWSFHPVGVTPPQVRTEQDSQFVVFLSHQTPRGSIALELPGVGVCMGIFPER